MQLNKLISLRAAQRLILAKQLEKLDKISSTSDSQKLLNIIQEKTHTIRGMNEKIINHADLRNIDTQLLDNEEYSIELEMSIHRYQEKITKLKETTFEQKDENLNHFTAGEVQHSTQPEEESTLECVPTKTYNRANNVTASTNSRNLNCLLSVVTLAIGKHFGTNLIQQCTRTQHLRMYRSFLIFDP
ncbi:hypothetical protein DPMN_152678 [Dreissena polymorpha]|uniref:Uncharacterized protein n=1 Tax=Dreissena polymorpha TaxID=45954 RepID=A0A9D4FHW5_DREPO|nr:hypothetical protein DPMN_152678 [Dreissena polymorpha]